MAFNSKKFKVKSGDPIKAVDINDLAERIARLEKITVGEGLTLDTANGIAIGLSEFNSLKDFYRFVQFEESITPEDILFSCKQVKRNNDRSISTTGKSFQFGNFFQYCAANGAYGLVIRFPSIKKEWTLIQTVCPEDVCSSGV